MLAHDCLLCVDVKLEYIYCVTLKLIYHFRLCRIAFVYVSTMNAMFSYGIFGGCMRNSMFNVTYKRHQNVKILAFGTFHSLAKLSVDIYARVYVRACKCVRENVCVCMWKIHELSNAKAQRHIFALQLTCRLAQTHTYVDSNQQPKTKRHVMKILCILPYISYRHERQQQ